MNPDIEIVVPAIGRVRHKLAIGRQRGIVREAGIGGDPSELQGLQVGRLMRQLPKKKQMNQLLKTWF